MTTRREVIARFTIVAATALLQTSAWAATIRDDQPDDAYLTLATTPAYAPVGEFVSSWGYTGCATLIAPDWVLTAAHNLAAANSATFTINGASYASSKFIIHPSWNGEALKGYDLALMHLVTPVVGVAPAELYRGLGEEGQIATFVGFGFTGTGKSGWRSLDNKKRAFHDVIDGDFGNPSVLLGSDFDNPHATSDNAFGEGTPLALEGCVAPGDSGGGVFVTIGGRSYLAGVISFVGSTDGKNDADYGDVTGFGRVSSFVPWIVTSIPEPSAAELVATSGFAALLVRCCWRGGRRT